LSKQDLYILHMHACMYVFMCIYFYVVMYVYIYIYIYVYIYIYIRTIHTYIILTLVLPLRRGSG
jgi:hypothetical protein